MRTTAANVAARAAVGGDDTFLKWQLMAEARQKSVSEAGKDGNQKSTSGGGRNSKDKQDGGRRFSGAGESLSRQRILLASFLLGYAKKSCCDLAFVDLQSCSQLVSQLVHCGFVRYTVISYGFFGFQVVGDQGRTKVRRCNQKW